MRNIQAFGGNGDRSAAGSLLSSTIARIVALLRAGGLLVAEMRGRWVIFTDPDAMPAQSGDERVLHYGSIDQLNSARRLNLGEQRVLEACTPSALILTLESADAPSNVTIPDSDDLRVLAATLGRPLMSVGPIAGETRDAAVARLARITEESERDHLIGELLGSRVSPARPTLAKVRGPREVTVLTAGDIRTEELAVASDRVSQWEIEDWT